MYFCKMLRLAYSVNPFYLQSLLRNPLSLQIDLDEGIYTVMHSKYLTKSLGIF